MPNVNCFGNPGSERPLVDPRRIRAARSRFLRPQVCGLDYANSLQVPSGPEPVRGFILMKRSDYDLVSPYRRDLQLILKDFGATRTALTLKGLTVVHAQCVSTGLASDPDAIYLVEVTDARGILSNRWWKQGIIAGYNLRAPAYPQLYYSGSLDGASAWTWTRMIGDLWTSCALLGAYPGLPVTPAGTPDGFWFPGTSVFEALSRALGIVGCTISCDLTSATPYGIADVGASDAAFTSATATYAGLIEEDLEWIDTGSGRVPGSLVVYFHRRNEQYGTEETVRRDSLQWSTNAIYSVTVSAPAQFSGALGTAHQWSDFTIRYDVDNNPLAADVATAATVAADQGTQFFAQIYRGTLGYMSRTYTGALPFATGSQVDGVRWYEHYPNQERAGWRTEVLRGSLPLWD
jgi:hypothetical protein